jgi:cytochrome c peroxidase
MPSKKLVAPIFIILAIVAFCSLSLKTSQQNVQTIFKQQLVALRSSVQSFYSQVNTNKTINLIALFKTSRSSYKRCEALLEYFYAYQAEQINGAPIPHVSEEELDRGILQPHGLQVIEEEVYATNRKPNLKKITTELQLLLQQIDAALNTQTSFAFTEGNVLDALEEEQLRIATLGITGFDATVSNEGITEAAAAFNGISEVLQAYNNLPVYQNLLKAINNASVYLSANTNFNNFDRALFFKQHINTISVNFAAVRQQQNLLGNISEQYKTSFRRGTYLFAANAINPKQLTQGNSFNWAKLQLGQLLFLDVNLSANKKRSCASCHNPNYAFAENKAKSTSLSGHSSLARNAPTLWNVSLQRTYFWDNRAENLEQQILSVLNSKTEMNHNFAQQAPAIAQSAAYQSLYNQAFAGTTNNAQNNLAQALATYLQSLVALNSRFDKYMRNTDTLSTTEKNGFNLFMGKAKCATCHFAPTFGGLKPVRFLQNETEVIGVPQNANNQKLDADLGRFTKTKISIHQYAFKTPSIRNSGVTAPYMHNGVYTSLSQVINFYNKGGGLAMFGAPKNQTLPTQNLQLTPTEQKSIIAFLHTLTDTAVTD